MSYKHFYQRFLSANRGKQHFACHSHHYWPDVTRDATLKYWDDSAAMVDDKWYHLFAEKLPAVQKHIAGILNTGHPHQIAFAPNTHELVMRILSCLDWQKPLKILTTDSEFHSFSRQINRLAENGNIQVERISTLPFDSFESRFRAALQAQEWDLVFFSQVFFNSGLAVSDLEGLVNAAPDSAIVCIDGYHGFMAMPTDLSRIAHRAFYLAGSYKYAQGGEGCCFVHVPVGCTLRPAYTGWFAEFGELDAVKTGQVGYSLDGMRFAGSTMDFSALYRLLAVFELFATQGLDVPKIHAYVQDLQQAFLSKLESINHPQLNRAHLLVQDLSHHGHFLTFKLDSADIVQALSAHLRQHGIVTDARGDRLRFGFALYHDKADYNLSCLEKPYV
ncbi:aminotransferase class V-fold PLP-dependent enzyme [Aliiglaciecola sp. CAU 1673]|uniref:aminotransferase class V-fold PLP-dependent enzyme n=1 Tax=Aliiglaciecola sp. CAU 1673 TaxID=3032595 RepID=UPI0023DCB757|nr:aminotransferase class V-fold PLP-dependent enzyme [Aliiglaciecola sp. CAU 1673]MDF2180407.1 aminotransferase class V-fold PLP-dependent enzyme [Aliiglaciecola sp. CAU 1673]